MHGFLLTNLILLQFFIKAATLVLPFFMVATDDYSVQPFYRIRSITEHQREGGDDFKTPGQKVPWYLSYFLALQLSC